MEGRGARGVTRFIQLGRNPRSIAIVPALEGERTSLACAHTIARSYPGLTLNFPFLCRSSNRQSLRTLAKNWRTESESVLFSEPVSV